MKDLMFFDCNVQIGNTFKGAGAGVQELLAEIDRTGVDYALVRHANLATAGCAATNTELAEMLKSDTSNRLYGVWSILPEQCDELPAGDALFEAMRQNRIKALTLDPENHRFVACRLSIGKIMDAAAERKIPVLLNNIKPWKAIYDFMQEFPRIYAIVNAGFKWGSDRNIRPLLENYPNLYAELGGYWVPEGVRDLAEKYGSTRILYGSMFPAGQLGCGMLQIKHSGLDARAVADIAGLNLKKLLEDAVI